MKIKILRALLLCVISTNLIFRKDKSCSATKCLNIIADNQKKTTVSWKKVIKFLGYYIEKEDERKNDLILDKLRFRIRSEV